MNIQGFFSAAYNTAASTTSGVYGFSKNMFNKGYSLTERVCQAAARYIPTTVSSTVQAYPKSFAFAAGVGTTFIIYQVFLKNRGQTPGTRDL